MLTRNPFVKRQNKLKYYKLNHSSFTRREGWHCDAQACPQKLCFMSRHSLLEYPRKCSNTLAFTQAGVCTSLPPRVSALLFYQVCTSALMRVSALLLYQASLHFYATKCLCTSAVLRASEHSALPSVSALLLYQVSLHFRSTKCLCTSALPRVSALLLY